MKNKEQKEYWIPCPVCKELSDIKVYEDTVMGHKSLLPISNNFSACKAEVRVDNTQLKMTVSK